MFSRSVRSSRSSSSMASRSPRAGRSPRLAPESQPPAGVFPRAVLGSGRRNLTKASPSLTAPVKQCVHLQTKGPDYRGFSLERAMGLEPKTLSVGSQSEHPDAPRRST
jgi:hypothetical protein